MDANHKTAERDDIVQDNDVQYSRYTLGEKEDETEECRKETNAEDEHERGL